MTESLRGLAALGALVVALALALVLAPGGPGAAVDRAVVPHLDPARVTRLTWSRPGQPAVELVRAHGAWTWTGPRAIPADRDAVADVLDTLQDARWHRRAARAAAGPIHATLRVGGAPGAPAIGIGRPIAGADQVWLVAGDRALLVDGWVARALDRSPLELRVRRPLAAAATADRLALSGAAGALTLADHQRRRDALWVAPALVHALDDALAAVELAALPASPPSAAPHEQVVLDGRELAERGPCPGHPGMVALTGPDGDGCVPDARWRAVLAAAAALEAAPEAVADRRPVPFAPAEVELAGGTVALTGHAHVTIGGAAHDADHARVAELARACGAAGTWTAAPAGALVGRVRARGKDHAEVVLELYPGDVARRDDGVALRLPHDAWLALARPARELLDPTRWVEDATTITAITLDGVTHHRGAVLGEWPGAKDPALVEALATALAEVRAPAHDLPRGFAPAHVVEVVFAPPVGAPSRHRLELGAPRAAGCAGRIDDTPVEAPLALCTAVAAAAR